MTGQQLDRRIRVCYVIDELRLGGTERQLVQVASGFDPTRVDAEIWCLRDDPSRSGLPVRCPTHILGINRLREPRSLLRVLAFARHLRRRPVDVIQTFFFDASLVGIVAGRLAGVPLVIASRRDLGYWHSSWTLRWTRLLVRAADRVLANAEAVRDSVVRMEGVPREKVDVIYNGVELPDPSDPTTRAVVRRHLGIPPDRLVIGIVANLNRPVKDVGTFIRAAAGVGERMPEATFLVVGDGPLRPELEAEAGRLGLEGRLRFVGGAGGPGEVIAALDVGVLSSLSEGLPNAILEYMAHGIPSVATAVGGVTEILEDGRTGLLVPPRNPEAMAQAILALAGSAEVRRAMGAEARRRIEANFALHNKIDEIEHYYRTHLAARRTRVSVSAVLSRPAESPRNL